MTLLKKSFEDFVSIRYNPEILRKLDRNDEQKFMFIGKRAKKRTMKESFSWRIR